MRDALSRALNTIWPSSIGVTTLSDEGRDLRALYAKATQLRKRSPLARLDLTQCAVGIMQTAVKMSGTNPPFSVLVAVAVAIEDLMTAEALVEPEINWRKLDIDGYEGLHLREFLTDQVRFFEKYDTNMEIWRTKIEIIFAGLLDYLPTTNIAASDDDAGFPVSIIDLLETPDEAIERLVVTPFDDDIRYAGLMREIRETFDNNALIASGINPREKNQTSKSITLPTSYKHDTPLDLVEAYVNRTAFAPFFTRTIPFSIPEHAKFEHCVVIGGTGHGKTQLLQSLIFADLKKAQTERRSVVVIDSQGDLIKKISHLALFDPDTESSLRDRLVIIDPTDVTWPVSLNIFHVNRDRIESRSPVEREKHLNGIIELYENFFGSLLGAELTQRQGVIFKYLARLMLEIPDANILTLRDLMDDPKPYMKYMKQLTGSARYFFEKEFFDKGFAATKKQIAKRLWGVLATPAFERMFAQPENKIDLPELLQSGHVVLINTSKELLKQEGTELFGRFFIAMIMQAAMERSAVAEDYRTPTFVYVDEASEYFDENFETILNQARKYKIGLICASQHLNQLSPGLRAGMLANTSIKVAGGVNAKDAGTLAAEMHTSSDFLQGMKKRRDTTEFALWVKHATPGSLRISVPLGFMERQPTMLSDTYDELIHDNRINYCEEFVEDYAFEGVSRFDDVSEEAATSPMEPPIAAPQPVEHPQPEPFVAQPPETEPTKAPAPAPPPNMGRGGRQHTYLQQFIKGLGEQHGWRSSIEEPTGNGEGFVDVALVRGEERIACEISVTTSSEHEVGNIQKCLDAGYETIWAVLHERRQVRPFERRLKENLSEEAFARVSVLRPDELPECFAELDIGEPDREETIRGRRVKVKRVKNKHNEAVARRETVAKVIAKSLRSQPDQ